MSRAISTSTNYSLADRTSNGTENATNQQAWSCVSPCCLSTHPLLADPVTSWSVFGPGEQTRSHEVLIVSYFGCEVSTEWSRIASAAVISHRSQRPLMASPPLGLGSFRHRFGTHFPNVSSGFTEAKSAPGFEALLFFYPSKQCNNANMLAPLPDS